MKNAKHSENSDDSETNMDIEESSDSIANNPGGEEKTDVLVDRKNIIAQSPSDGNSMLEKMSQSPRHMKTPPTSKAATRSDTYDTNMLSLSPIRLEFEDEKLASTRGTFTKDAIVRELYVTKEDFRAHEFVRLFYTALLSAKESYKKFEKTTYKLKRGENYFFPKALEVRANSDKWQWGTLQTEIGKPIDARIRKKNRRRAVDGTIRTPSTETKTYYIIGSLGQGSTSNVFQAIDQSGELVAIKVFVNNIDEEQGGILAKDDFKKRAKDACDREKMALLECYKFLNGRVHVIKICGFHAVVMPIFEPIAKDDRSGRLNDIKEVLTKLYRRGKVYRDDDVRFRHVGLFKDGGQDHVVLFDFADLDLVNESETDSWVTKHMGIFKARCLDDISREGNALFETPSKQS